jgi:hypothetical protein
VSRVVSKTFYFESLGNALQEASFAAKLGTVFFVKVMALTPIPTTRITTIATITFVVLAIVII